MKLNVYSQETLPNKSGRSPVNKIRVSFSPTGMVSFSLKACELMGLKKGEKVCLAQDDHATYKWYFFKDEAGYPLNKHEKGGCWFSHKQMVKEFIQAWDLPRDKRCRCEVVADPVRSGKKICWLLQAPVVHESAKSSSN